MPANTIAVTDREFELITEAHKAFRNVVTDSQYVETPADRIARVLGRAAFKRAWDRHDGWHTRWEAAATDAARDAVEAECEAAERTMKRVSIREGGML